MRTWFLTLCLFAVSLGAYLFCSRYESTEPFDIPVRLAPSEHVSYVFSPKNVDYYELTILFDGPRAEVHCLTIGEPEFGGPPCSATTQRFRVSWELRESGRVVARGVSGAQKGLDTFGTGSGRPLFGYALGGVEAQKARQYRVDLTVQSSPQRLSAFRPRLRIGVQDTEPGPAQLLLVLVMMASSLAFAISSMCVLFSWVKRWRNSDAKNFS